MSTTKRSKLPEWLKRKEFPCPHCAQNLNLPAQATEALTIAIEAMQGEGHMCPEEDHKRGKHWGGCLKHALRRIEELK